MTPWSAPWSPGALPWSDLVVGGTAACTSPDPETKVVAGQSIQCTTPGTLTVAHVGTNTLLYETAFA